MKKISENSGRNKIDGFEEYSLRRKKRAIWTAAGCVLAALMVVGISFALRSQGRALGPDVQVQDVQDASTNDVQESAQDASTNADDSPEIKEVTQDSDTTGEGNDDTTGSETTGGDTTDSETTGGDTTGSETTGGDTTGSETTGGDTTGSETTGGDTTDPGTTVTQEKLNLDPYVKTVVFSTNQNGNWVVKDKVDGQYSFDSDDNVQAKFTCKDIPVRPLENGAIENGAYIRLPESIKFPGDMVGKSVPYIDGGYAGDAGTYQLIYDANKIPYASFTFTEGYLKWIRDEMLGKIDVLRFDFKFTWKVDQDNGQVKQENIHLGDFNGAVNIKPSNKQNNSTQNSGYYAQKEVEKTRYENGNMFITYKITVWVGSHQDKAIVLSDAISYGTDFNILNWKFEYGNNTHNDDYVKLTNDSKEKKTITIGDDTGVDAGTYTICYEASFNVGELKNADVAVIENKLTGDNNINSSTVTYTNTNPLTKSGRKTTNESAGEVVWEVRINDGKTLYTFGENETFTDTLPAGTKLVDDNVKIIQYNEGWNETGVDTTCTVKKENGMTLLTATLPSGAYRYKIVYKTIQENPPEAGKTTNIVNKAEIGGEIQYETSAEVTFAPPVITKELVEVLTKSKQFYTDSNGKREVFEFKWSVKLASVEKGVEYIDKGGEYREVSLLMSQEQIDGIVVTCEGKTLEKDKYVITVPDENDPNTVKENLLFKIAFNDNYKNVTINYTCYADVTNVTGDGFNVKNWFGGVEAGQWISNKFKSQSTNLFKYVEGTNINEHYFFTNSKIAIGTKDTLNWVIVAEPDCHPNAPLEFTDTLPEGLSFDAGTLKITADGFELDPGDYDYQIDKNVITLRVYLAGKTFGGWKKYGDTSNDNNKLFKLVIKYDTKITDLADGGKKEYTNTVEWDGNTVDQSVTVTRDVIGKNGSFNEKTGMLRYSVIINPDGVDLNPDGDLLRVEDTLTDRGGLSFKLDGVALYNLTDVDGKKVPGSLVTELKPLQEKPTDVGSANTYYYDANTYTFTAFIPDKTGYALVYDYRVLNYDKVGQNITVKNKASLYGGSKSYDSTEISTTVLEYSMNAVGNAQTANLFLEKRDANYSDKLLEGAEFTVSSWDEAKGEWVKFRVYTTDANGSVALSSLEADVLYKIAETKAPDKYAINNDIKYFMLSKDPEKASVPNGVKDVTKDDITIYQYGTDQDGTDIPVSVMKWFDKRLGTTDLLVKKNWQDGSREPITWDKGSLNFDLYRKTVPKDQVPDYIEGKTYIYELTVDDLTQIETKYEDYRKAHDGEFVGEYTLKPSEEGEWELLIPDLAQTDKDGNVYQYYLVETSMGKDTLSDSDYLMRVEYKNTSGTEQYQAEITITNIIVSDYSLPETGAEGSWIDRIIGWFQQRYQNIVHFFRKE